MGGFDDSYAAIGCGPKSFAAFAALAAMVVNLWRPQAASKAEAMSELLPSEGQGRSEGRLQMFFYEVKVKDGQRSGHGQWPGDFKGHGWPEVRAMDGVVLELFGFEAQRNARSSGSQPSRIHIYIYVYIHTHTYICRQGSDLPASPGVTLFLGGRED